MRSIAMYSFCDDIWFGKKWKNRSIIIYSMIEVSVCLGNEKEDGKEGEDEKHSHVQLCDDIWFGK